MAGRVLRIYKKLGSRYTRQQNADRQEHYTDATELSVLTAQTTDDRSICGADGSQDPHTEHAGYLQIHRLRRRFSGWRFAVIQFAAWASIVFFINLFATIWVSTTMKKTGGNLSEGDCGRVKNLNRGFHVLINVLSTVLLSGSNYCMQCLSAPSRADIDTAHAARNWLEIGIPSIRNLSHIGQRRLYVWLLLGFSSIPLHLL